MTHQPAREATRSQPTAASLDKAPVDVAGMFDTVARRYDVTNDVLSLGQVRRWRKVVRETLVAGPGRRILDVACGTATSTADLADAGASVIGADFSLGMLTVGHQRRPDLSLVAADALALPFDDDVFDAVTISYGLRNIADVSAALREFLRVTKPGGMLLVNEFSTPQIPGFRQLYSGYLMQALPAIARRLGSNGPSYGYLAESIRDWPDQNALALQIRDAGWTDPAWRNLSGGIVALHRAYKAAPTD